MQLVAAVVCPQDVRGPSVCLLVRAALRSRCGHYTLPCGFFPSFFFFLPNLSRRRLDVYHTSTHGLALVRIWDVGLKRVARGSLKNTGRKNRRKFVIWAPSHNFVGLYLRNLGTYRQSKKTC